MLLLWYQVFWIQGCTSTWFEKSPQRLGLPGRALSSLLMLNCLPSMLVFFSPVFVLALSGEVLFWIFSFVTNKNQIYSDAESRGRRRSDVLEMKAQLVTHNSAEDHSQAGLTADATTYRSVDWDSVFLSQDSANSSWWPLQPTVFVRLCYLFLYGSWDRNGFTSLNGWNQTRRRTVFGDTFQVPTNKVFWDTASPICLSIKSLTVFTL